MSGGNSLLDFGVLRNQARVRGLPIDKPEQALDSQGFVWVATIHQDFRFRLVRKHVLNSKMLLLLDTTFLDGNCTPMGTDFVSIGAGLRATPCHPEQVVASLNGAAASLRMTVKWRLARVRLFFCAAKSSVSLPVKNSRP